MGPWRSEEGKRNAKLCKQKYRQSARGKQLSSVWNAFNNPINSPIYNPINNPPNNAARKEATLQRNIALIQANPDLSKELLSSKQIADEAEALYNKPLETLGMKSIKQVT